MSRIEDRLRTLGLTLPPSTPPPAGVLLPFKLVRIIGDCAMMSGHGPQNPDGSFAQPWGKVGRAVSLDDLDRVTAWSRSLAW